MLIVCTDGTLRGFFLVRYQITTPARAHSPNTSLHCMDLRKNLHSLFRSFINVLNKKSDGGYRHDGAVHCVNIRQSRRR